jgi:uncharacterized protein (DUF111 family)
VTDKIAWLDLSCGASAEMLLGALVDAGVPFDVVSAAVRATGLPVALQSVASRRGELTATWLLTQVTLPVGPSTNFDELDLPDDARTVLASLEQVNVTDIAEVVAVCAGLRWLREEGQLSALHSTTASTTEASTPVGTALTHLLVESWAPMPSDHVGLVGVGAGSVEVSDHAHVLKLVLAT